MSRSEEISMSISSILSISFRHLPDTSMELVCASVLSGGELLVDLFQLVNRRTNAASKAGRVPLVNIHIHSDSLH